MTHPSLEQLGQRIMIIGFSSSGKSTLADRLGKKLHLPVYHIDLIAHHPNTHWQRRSDDEFLAEHNKLIQQEKWILEGNYRIGVPKRLARATSIIWVESNRFLAAYRFIKRAWPNDPKRIGRLAGTKSDFAWYMLKHILWTWPKYRSIYQKMIDEHDLPLIKIKSMRELEALNNAWKLL